MVVEIIIWGIFEQELCPNLNPVWMNQHVWGWELAYDFLIYLLILEWCHWRVNQTCTNKSLCWRNLLFAGKQRNNWLTNIKLLQLFVRHWAVHFTYISPFGRKPGFNTWVGKIPWRRKWQPTPVLLPGESQEWRSLVGHSPWGRKESDTTERFHFSLEN